MVRSRLGLKALGLCALVLGLMAIGAGAAQAEAGGKWFIAGAELKAPLELEVAANFEPETDGSLLSEIIGIPVQFLCTSFQLINVKLAEGGLLLLGGLVKFSGCKTLLGKLVSKVATDYLESKACEPFEVNAKKEVEKGVVLSREGKGLLALHTGGETTTLIEPDNAEGKFGTIHMGEECAIGEEVPVFGKLVLKDTEATTEKTEHLISQHSLTHLFVISDTAEHAANIDGSAKVKLAGTHAGKLWSGKAK